MDRKQFQHEHTIIGQSPEIQEIIAIVQQVAPTNITVLISGESGVGKEVFAQALHAASKRAKNQLVSVNCGAIPEGLIESELFGHERGSFTSASETRKGYFEIAAGGTIFLDEIGEMPLATQVKLLRVLENGEYKRVGSSTTRTADVRVIAATNKDLQYETQQKRFRPDLFFRLRTVNIVIPPLRNRKEDIPLLIDHIVHEYSAKNAVQFEGFTDDATEILMSYHWPGNVRELRNVVESMLVLHNGKRVNGEDIRRQLKDRYAPANDRNLPMVVNKSVEQAERELIYRALIDLKSEILELRQALSQKVILPEHFNIHDFDQIKGNGSHTLAEMERRLITTSLDRNKGNRRLAARELNISERTLYRKIKEYGLD
ncbi:MAG: sigma-54 dependent transcriptional regulator [bacterium]